MRPRKRQATVIRSIINAMDYLNQHALPSPSLCKHGNIPNSDIVIVSFSLQVHFPLLTPFRREKLLHSPGEQLASFTGSLAMSLPKSSKTPAIGTAIDVWSTGMIASIRIHKRNTSETHSLHRHRHLRSPLQPLFSCRQYHCPRSA